MAEVESKDVQESVIVSPKKVPASEAVKTEEEVKNGNGAAVAGEEEPLDSKIRKQIEFYFGDNNFPRDRFMKGETAKDNGWLPIDILLKFNRLVAHLQGISDEERVKKIAEALGSSTLVDVHEGGLKVRRNPDIPFPEGNSNTRTVYLKGVNKSASLDTLLAHFLKYAGAQALIMRYYKEKTIQEPPKVEEPAEGATNGSSEKPKLESAPPTKIIWQRKFKGSIFLVFDTEANAKKLIDEEGTSYEGVPLLKMSQKDYQNKKDEEYKARIEKKQDKKKDKQGGDRDVKEEDFSQVPNGVFLKLSGIPEGVGFQAIKDTWVDKFDVDKFKIAYIDMDRGATEGVMRLCREGAAGEVLELCPDKKLTFKDDKFLVMESATPEEEKIYKEKVNKDRSDSRKRAHGGGRGGRGGGGRGGKRGRRH